LEQYLTLYSKNGCVGDSKKKVILVQLVLQAFSLSHMNVASNQLIRGLNDRMNSDLRHYIGKKLALFIEFYCHDESPVVQGGEG
jgi:hypothetical protein